jgi:hypothetical protein
MDIRKIMNAASPELRAALQARPDVLDWLEWYRASFAAEGLDDARRFVDEGLGSLHRLLPANLADELIGLAIDADTEQANEPSASLAMALDADPLTAFFLGQATAALLKISDPDGARELNAALDSMAERLPTDLFDEVVLLLPRLADAYEATWGWRDIQPLSITVH